MHIVNKPVTEQQARSRQQIASTQAEAVSDSLGEAFLPTPERAMNGDEGISKECGTSQESKAQSGVQILGEVAQKADGSNAQAEPPLLMSPRGGGLDESELLDVDLEQNMRTQDSTAAEEKKAKRRKYASLLLLENAS